MTFNGRFLLNLIHFAGVQGASVNKLLIFTGLNETDLGSENQKVSAQVFNHTMENAVKETGDPFFGLHAGEYLNLSAAGLIAQITQTSRTVKEALDYCCEFSMLGCQHIPLELKREKKLYKLLLIPDPEWQKQSTVAAKQTVEGLMAFTLREFHTITLQKHYPVAVHFSGPAPSDVSEYHRIFNCELKFNRGLNAMYFNAEQVEEPIVTANYELLRILVNHARERLESLGDNAFFYEKVKRAMVNLVNPEFPLIEHVAGNLNLSVRSLQRKLAAEGHTFIEIREELRRTFALDYLKNPELQITEIAYLLSYSDASAFIRSFRRWTGQSPQRYRKTKYQLI